LETFFLPVRGIFFDNFVDVSTVSRRPIETVGIYLAYGFPSEDRPKQDASLSSEHRKKREVQG
jgi:hypothetical protein